MVKKLVIASNNPGKLQEISQILAPLSVETVPQSVLGVPEAAEPHATFVENALAKARGALLLHHSTAARRTGSETVDRTRPVARRNSARAARVRRIRLRSFVP